MLSLWHNIWIKPENEATIILYNILQDNSLKLNYWIKEVNYLTEIYNLPSVTEMKNMTPLSKQAWKTMVKEKVVKKRT